MMGEERRGRDRRKDRRYNCGGRVRLWQTESGVTMLGSIMNLSMGGCLIEVQTASAFDIHSIIETSFQSSYLAFRTMASVQSLDEKRNLIGISYMNLSLRGRLDLGELFVDLDALIAEGYWGVAGTRRLVHPHAAEESRLTPASGPFLLPL
jgi:PilZ domain